MKKTATISILLVTLVTPISANTDSNKAAQQHFEKANGLLKQMDYEAAIAEYGEVIDLSSGSKIAQDAQYWIGQSHFRAGQYDAAQATFAKLIETYPKSNIVPVTKLMVERVKQEKEAEEKRRALSNAIDRGYIIDPKSDVKYTKIKTFTGKRDVVRQVAWQLDLSPNGKFLLWNSIVIPVDSGEPFNLVDMPAALGTWSPDGKKAIFRSEGAIWVIPVSPETGRSTGAAKKLLDGGYQYNPFVGWSPDSKKIVFERDDKEGRGNICTLSVEDGTLSQITDDPVREWRPIWSPDGKSIAYSRGSEIRIIPAEGGRSKKIVDNGLPRFWSPDGRWLVYIWKNSERFIRLTDKNEFVWNYPRNTIGQFVSWSSNSEKMIFYRSSYDWSTALKVVYASGGPSFELGRRSPLQPYRQYWSADNDMIVTEGEGGFWVCPLAGREPFLLEIDVSLDGDPKPCCLSPDGTTLLFAVERSAKRKDLYVVPVSLKDGCTTGSAVMIFSGWKTKLDYARELSWSPDGTKVAVIHEGNIWMASVDGDKPVRIATLEHPDNYRRPGWSVGGHPGWSPDGTKIAYRIYHSEKKQILRVIPASGTEDTILLDIPLTYKGGYQWSADSKDLLYASGKSISAISVADGQSREFLELKGLSIDSCWGFSWSPDGKTLAFIGMKGGNYKIFTVPAKGGKFAELATDDTGEKYWLWWSPDGEWISYQSDGWIKTCPEGTMWEADFKEILEKASKIE